MDMITLLLALIGITVVILIVGTMGYWFHLRLTRLEQRLCDCNQPEPATAEVVECSLDDVEEEPSVADDEDDRLSVPESELVHQDIEVPEEHGDELVDVEQTEEHSDELVVVEQTEEQELVEVERSDAEQEETVPPTNTPASEPSVDYDSMTIPVLRDLCTSRGIAWTRKDRKADLITHLQSSDARE